MGKKLLAVIIISIFITSASFINLKNQNMVLIPSGEFEMGDHHELGGLEHGNDEIPVHKVFIDSFYISKTEVTNNEYLEFLSDSLTKSFIEIKNGKVYQKGTEIIYCDTEKSDPASRFIWDGKKFSIVQYKENHPAVCIRWNGAAAFCIWLSINDGYEKCYDEINWEADFTKKGYRLPTEAEWEYAALGGKYSPYYIYWYGNELDYSKANLPKSGDPFETGPLPYTTPVSFYNGKIQLKADFNWPGTELSYKTTNGANGYGLYDIAGNVWEWCNDWYCRDYYYFSPDKNPGGPAENL
jgi:sulfatase modifying factor 1